MSTQLPSTSKHAQLTNSLLGLYMTNDNLIHQNLSFILDTIVNHRLFNVTETEEIAAVHRKWTVRLNALLQSKNVPARWCGIVLVRVTCENSHSLLLSNAKSWCAQLLGFKPEPTMIHQESIQTLSSLFSYTADKPELQREIATPHLQRYNQLLLQLGRKDELLPVVLSALTANVKSFPSTARHISEQCLQICLSCLDGSKEVSTETIKAANQCLVSLYIAGGKAHMADQWKDSLLRLIGSVHECLNRLFDTVDEESLDSELPKSYPFLPVASDYVDAFPVLLRRIQLIQDCICTFLTTCTSIAVGVPVVHLVDLICRVYNVFEGSLMREFKDKSEFLTLMMCLPALHLSTSKVFTSLLYCSGQELIRYNKLFSRILLRLLNEHKHKRTLKTSIYQLISLCLEKCGYSFADHICKPLVLSIIQDLHILEHKATVQPHQQQHKKRKTEVTNSDALTSKLVCVSSTDVQIAALESLCTLLDVFGFAMENNTRASVDTLILSRLIQVIPPSDMSNEDVVLVKAELYKCLIASVTHPIETQASILPHASRLFSAGTNDQSHQLQSICKKGLSVCDLVMHARLPPVQRVMPKTTPAVTVRESEQESESESELEETIQEQQVDKQDIQLVTKVTETVEQVIEKPSITLPSAPIQKPVSLERESFKPVSLDVESLKPVSLDTETPKPVSLDTETPKPVSLNAQENSSLIDITPIKPSTTATELEAIDLSLDMDMDMPMIDLTGPDSEDDEE